MSYPIESVISLPEVFLDESIRLTFYSGLTILVGPNGSGKTQVMRKLKDDLKSKVDGKLVRYLSSNRIGTLEQYRSKTTPYYQDYNSVNLGGIDAKNKRHELEVATGDFFALDERKDIYIKVTERLSKLFNRNVFLQWDSGNLKVYFKRNKFSKEYSIASESSGLVNIVSILAALYDDDVKVLLIDEPEVSLHPQLQAFLLSEIMKVAGDYNEKNKKMVIMATHSTDMINIRNIESLSNYIFFLEDGKAPVQIMPNSEELKNSKLKDLIPRLGQIHKKAFFIERPLLVEGVSDSLMCNYFDDRFELYLGVSGTHVIPIDGKGEFAATVKLMRLIGKKPVIIADLDAFVDNNDIVNIFINDEKVKIKAQNLGHADASGFLRAVKSDFNNLVNKKAESICDKFQEHPYWINREENKDMARKRAIMAILMKNNRSEIEKWDSGSEWNSIKTRVEILLDCIEEAGCFILRKGAIESYYTFSDENTSSGKPSAAVKEIESLNNKGNEFIEKNYFDILRALRYSARFKNIDETESIKLEVLSEIAPIVNILKEDTTIDDINTIIRKARGNSESLFKYEPKLIDGIPAIEVDLESKILETSGFPFVVKKGDDVISIANSFINK